MAIKVSGTTVINDSRELTNITSVDATTVAALGAAGVGGGGGIELTTSEAVVEGDTLAFNFSTGKVEKVARFGGTTQITNHTSNNFAPIDILYIPSIDKTALMYYEGATNSTRLVVGEQAINGTFTWGTSVSVVSGNQPGCTLEYDSNVNRLAVFHRTGGSNLKCTIYSISGNSVSGEQTTTLESSHGVAGSYPLAAHFDDTNNRMIIMYNDSNGYGVTRVGTLGASSQSWSSATGPSSGIFDDNNPQAMAITSNGNSIFFGWKDPPHNQTRGIVGQWNGSSWTWGSEVTLNTEQENSTNRSQAFRLTGSANAGQCTYLVHFANNVHAINFTLSGYSISNVSVQSIAGNNNGYMGGMGGYDAANDLYYTVSSESGQIVVTYSTTPSDTWTYGDAAVIASEYERVVCATFDTTTKYITLGAEGTNRLYTFAPQEDNYLQFIGVAAEAASANSTVKINSVGTVATGLSGITAGNFYRIKFDGTFENLGSSTGVLSYSNKHRTTGVALTSTTMLMINSMMHTA